MNGPPDLGNWRDLRAAQCGSIAGWGESRGLASPQGVITTVPDTGNGM